MIEKKSLKEQLDEMTITLEDGLMVVPRVILDELLFEAAVSAELGKDIIDDLSNDIEDITKRGFAVKPYIERQFKDKIIFYVKVFAGIVPPPEEKEDST